MGPRRSLLAAAARAAAISLLAACSAGAAAAQRGRPDGTATAPAAESSLFGRKLEGRLSLSAQDRERPAPVLAKLFAEQALLEPEDHELLRQQNSLWAEGGVVEAGAGAGAEQEERLAVPLGVVAATKKHGNSEPFVSSQEMAEAGAGEGGADLQEDGEQGGDDGIAAAAAGIATGVLAALAAAAGASAAPADDGSETATAPRLALLRATTAGLRALRGATVASTLVACVELDKKKPAPPIGFVGLFLKARDETKSSVEGRSHTAVDGRLAMPNVDLTGR